MLHKVIILLSITIFSSIGLCGAVSGALIKKVQIQPSIFNEMHNDSEICDTPKIAVLPSNYVSKCKEISFSSTNHSTPLNNTDAFLCLGLYDRVYQMCHSRSLEFKIPALMNKTVFESLMADEMKNASTVLIVCLSFETKIQVALYNKTKPFVDQLSEALKDPNDCTRICRSEKTKLINPLCLAIQMIDRNIQNELLEKTTSAELVKAVDPQTPIQANTKTVLKEANDHQLTASKTGTSPTLQSGNSPSKSQSNLNTSLIAAPQSDGKSTSIEHSKKDNQKVNEPTDKKDINQNQSKPIAPNEDLKNNEKKGNEKSSQEQSPSPSTEKATKKVDTPKKEAVESNDGDSLSQIITPGKNPPEEKSSTVSENTGNGDFDQAMEQNYDAAFREAEAGPPEIDTDDDVNSPPQKEVNSIKDAVVQDSFHEANNVPKPPRLPDDDSHFFGYFTIFGFLGFTLFLAYHHKHKIFAMLLEGRRSRGGRARRRPSTANYRKLDCTLEEAVTSQCSSNVTHVIY